MLTTYILFFVPLLLFVAAFLYETWLSYARLGRSAAGRAGYVETTWEITHTLLVFSLVVVLMMFSRDITTIASAVLMPVLWAVATLAVRAACYLYIHYVKTTKQVGAVDWIYFVSHLVAAVFLVYAVIKIVWFFITEKPEANLQFLPYFVPGLVLVLLVCAIPLLVVYRSK